MTEGSLCDLKGVTYEAQAESIRPEGVPNEAQAESIRPKGVPTSEASLYDQSEPIRPKGVSRDRRE